MDSFQRMNAALSPPPRIETTSRLLPTTRNDYPSRVIDPTICLLWTCEDSRAAHRPPSRATHSRSNHWLICHRQLCFPHIFPPFNPHILSHTTRPPMPTKKNPPPQPTNSLRMNIPRNRNSLSRKCRPSHLGPLQLHPRFCQPLIKKLRLNRQSSHPLPNLKLNWPQNYHHQLTRALQLQHPRSIHCRKIHRHKRQPPKNIPPNPIDPYHLRCTTSPLLSILDFHKNHIIAMLPWWRRLQLLSLHFQNLSLFIAMTLSPPMPMFDYQHPPFLCLYVKKTT